MKRKNVIVLLLVLLVIMTILSLWLGYTTLSLKQIIEVFIGQGTKQTNLIVMSFRLPRILLAILSGIGFSLSGLVLQSMTHNPLADPGILGINAGAGVVIVAFLTFSGTLTFLRIVSLPFLAFLGAVLTGLFIFFLSQRGNFGLNPTKMVLNGIAIQLGMNAIMTLLSINLDSSEFTTLSLFQAGSFWNASFDGVVSLIPWILFFSLLLFSRYRTLDILSCGDEIAVDVGVRVKREKLFLLMSAIALAASSVSVVGSLNFVGLVAPHLARRFVGNKHIYLLPCSALLGALLVLIADVIARVVIQPASIPTGLITSLIGAPYFMYLLFKARKETL